jgi:hypothetical protein
MNRVYTDTEASGGALAGALVWSGRLQGQPDHLQPHTAAPAAKQKEGPGNGAAVNPQQDGKNADAITSTFQKGERV